MIDHIDTEITKMLKVICSKYKEISTCAGIVMGNFKIIPPPPSPPIMDEHVKTLAREDTDILTETKE